MGGQGEGQKMGNIQVNCRPHSKTCETLAAQIKKPNAFSIRAPNCSSYNQVHHLFKCQTYEYKLRGKLPLKGCQWPMTVCVAPGRATRMVAVNVNVAALGHVVSGIVRWTETLIQITP